MKKPIRDGLRYLTLLCERCDQKLLPTDKLSIEAHRAQAAMQSLYMTIHYLGCSGVGLPDEPSLNVSAAADRA